MPSFNNRTCDILSAWHALEILSPYTFRKVEDLSKDNKDYIINLYDDYMPWENNQVYLKKDYNLHYHIVLGTIDMNKSMLSLSQIYPDENPERFFAKGQAIIASFIVNEKGIPIDENFLIFSSFAWGLSKVIDGKLEELANWQEQEASLVGSLSQILRKTNSEGTGLTAVNSQMIEEAYHFLERTLNLSTDFLNPPKFSVISYQHKENLEPVTPLMMNSFFLNDLSLAQRVYKNNQAPLNLKKYLGEIIPNTQYNLLKDNNILERILAPSNFPHSSWIREGHFPLSFLQQVGVNIALKGLDNKGGILAINGPPGTGKTTLLNDIIAEVITNRAKAMSKFDNPCDAFKSSGKLSTKNRSTSYYKLDETIKGHEILIASSNNKAVENLTLELPDIQAIASDSNLKYFSTLASHLMGKDCWGAISGILGNGQNINHFTQSFWWNKDYGMMSYLYAASGHPQMIQEKDGSKRKPIILDKENPPQTRSQALERWKIAKNNFLNTEAEILKAFEDTEDFRSLNKEKNFLEKAIEKISQNSHSFLELQISTEEHCTEKPKLLNRLLNLSDYSSWKKNETSYLNEFKRLNQEKKQLIQEVSSYYEILPEECQPLAFTKEKLENVNNIINNYQEKYNFTDVIDEDFFTKPHDNKQTSSPWYSAKIYQLREKLFVDAIHLHKAFIDCAATPIRQNLSIFFEGLKGWRNIQGSYSINDLWSTVFLVVPTLSSTFSSIEKMLSNVPLDSLGWLLIDEAGQAQPQSAVGGIMRCKKIVVVGDPLQVEPVVSLPESLTKAICREFSVDPNIYNCPTASAQTLCDRSSTYITEFKDENTYRMVGVPLLVHRRCEEPMFGIANKIAYNNLMINKKIIQKSPIRDCIGHSKWIHVENSSPDKWSAKEGEKVLDILKKLKMNNIEPNLYIITPFREIQDNMRSLVQKSRILQGWVQNPKWIYERIGTIHIVQGREAEAIIFILGAEHPIFRQAREWAGKKPNLLNVAVTRAKEALYVIGNYHCWKNVGYFQALEKLPLELVPEGLVDLLYE